MAVSAGEPWCRPPSWQPRVPEIVKLQRVLGKKTLENEILKEAVEYAAEKSGLRARLVAGGRPIDGRLPGAWAGALECPCNCAAGRRRG